MGKTLAEYRNLKTAMFRETALKMASKEHGATWVKRLFALAGFRENVFYQALETEDLTVKKFLTATEKDGIISLVVKIADGASIDSGGYKWSHPVYGEGATRNRGEIVGRCFSISIKKMGLLIIDGDGTILPDPMDDKTLIIRKGKQDGAVKKADIIGFWSNWLPSPVSIKPNISEVFEIS